MVAPMILELGERLGAPYSTESICYTAEAQHPRAGDGIHTFGEVNPLKPKSAFITLGIQAAQRYGTWQGVPKIPAPLWGLTHSMTYYGALSDTYIVAAWRAGLITWQEAKILSDHNDWVFSMTHPVGLWVRWRKILEQHSGVVSRPEFCRFSEAWQLRALEHALWWFQGRKYDTDQLFGILANVLGETDPQHYNRIIDKSPFTTVCSGTYGAAMEAVRRQAILRALGEHGAREWITCDDQNEWPNAGGDGWWPRILNKLHLEKYAPGQLCLRPWFRIVMEF